MCVQKLECASALSNHRYYCPEGSQRQTGFNGTSSHPCRTGHYCPSGTGNPTEYPCRAGTFNNQTGASSNSSCLDCAAGFASSDGASSCSVCNAGTYELNAQCVRCKKGHWCKDGLAIPCPVNTYAALTYTHMHGHMEGAIGTGTHWMQKMSQTVKNATKVGYPRKGPHKLQTVHPTLQLPSSFIHVHAVCKPLCVCSCAYSLVVGWFCQQQHHCIHRCPKDTGF